MKNTLFLIAFLSFILTIGAQNLDKPGIAFQFSVAAIGDEPLNPRNFKNKDWRIPSLEVAFQKFTRKGHFHHLGIYGLNYQNEILSHAELKEYGIGLRYKFAFEVLKITEKLKVYIGPSLVAQYRFSEYRPFTSIDFPVEESIVEVIFGAVPSLKWQTKDRVFFHLGIPVSFVALSKDSVKFLDPSLTERQQKEGAFATDFLGFQRFEIELGIGWKF